MENSTLLTEKPIRGRSGAAADTGLLDISHIKGTVYTVPNNTRGGFSPRPKDEFLKKDKSFIRNVITNMNQKVFTKDDVSDIIKTGVTSYLNQNKNISVKDLLTKKSRERAGNQLKSTLKTTALDTGQNVINSLRQEEVSRRKKPSAIKKKAKLNAALEKLKKARASVQENTAQFDKLVKAVRNTPDLSKGKTAKLLKIAGKIRGMRTEASNQNRHRQNVATGGNDVSGPLATRDDKGSAMTRNPGGAITQKQNPRVGKPDGPDDKRTKRGERRMAAIDRLNDRRKRKIKSGLEKGAKVASATGKVAVAAVKKGGSMAKKGTTAAVGGYGQSSFG